MDTKKSESMGERSVSVSALTEVEEAGVCVEALVGEEPCLLNEGLELKEPRVGGERAVGIESLRGWACEGSCGCANVYGTIGWVGRAVCGCVFACTCVDASGSMSVGE